MIASFDKERRFVYGDFYLIPFDILIGSFFSFGYDMMALGEETSYGSIGCSAGFEW